MCWQLAAKKEYWMTESGAWNAAGDGSWQGVAMAARFLNDLNHGVRPPIPSSTIPHHFIGDICDRLLAQVTHWVYFIGASHSDTQILGGGSRQQDMHWVATFANNGTYKLMPTYHYAKQLRATFDLGARLRHSVANISTPGQREASEMDWTYGKHSDIYAAVGENPDGSWGIGVVNPTGCPTVEDLNGKNTSLFSDAKTLTVQVLIAELADSDAPLKFAAQRSTGKSSYAAKEEAVAMVGGRLTVVVGPNELLTLRSGKAQGVEE